MSDAPTVLIMGPPGAGKGTQAAHLRDHYHLRHVATGDLLRDAVAHDTPLGQTARTYMDAGNLVPDDIIIAMLRELVESLGDEEGVLLDGYPRTVAQAEALDGLLGELERHVNVVLDIRVPAEVLVHRISGRWVCRTCQTPYNVTSHPPKVAGKCDLDGGELFQREDDAESAVRHRLDVYEAQTAPVSDYYLHRDVLATIDGNQPAEAVQAALDAAMHAAV